jgi:hypothetical protein
MLEAAQIAGKALAESVAQFAWSRGVIGARSPSREESSEPGALIWSPSRTELDLASRQPLQIMQARNGLVDRAVVLPLPVQVHRGRIDGEVVKHRAQVPHVAYRGGPRSRSRVP